MFIMLLFHGFHGLSFCIVDLRIFPCFPCLHQDMDKSATEQYNNVVSLINRHNWKKNIKTANINNHNHNYACTCDTAIGGGPIYEGKKTISDLHIKYVTRIIISRLLGCEQCLRTG